jgi:RNA-directed DNA polymerase
MQGPAGNPRVSRNPLPVRSCRAHTEDRAGCFFPQPLKKVVPSGSFERLSSLEALWRAWLRCRQGKRRQPNIAAFDLDADTHLCRLHRRLRGGSFVPGLYRLSVIHDPKTRLVAAPALPDRIVQHALLAEIGPTFERGFISQSFACCSGRGPHRALLAYLGLTRRFTYRLCLDVRRYFASIHHTTLIELFARRLRDPQTLALLSAFLEAGGAVYRSPQAIEVFGLGSDPLPEGCGLPLGSYLSHWSGALYLDGLDHFVKRTLRVKGYLRYMDDLAFFGDDRRALEDVREQVRDWLVRERRLELKPRRDAVQPTAQPATYLGFRISRAGLLPGPKAKRRLKELLENSDDLGHERLVRSLVSYRGLLLSL